MFAVTKQGSPLVHTDFLLLMETYLVKRWCDGMEPLRLDGAGMGSGTALGKGFLCFLHLYTSLQNNCGTHK